MYEYKDSKRLERAQNNCIKKFNAYLKREKKEILSINELTGNWYVINFKNKSTFKFKWWLPLEKIPPFKIGIWNSDLKIKRLF